MATNSGAVCRFPSEDANLTAVAIDKDRHSAYAVKWAIDHLLITNSLLILIHVNNKSSQMKTSTLNGVAPNENGDIMDADMQQVFSPFRGTCTRKGIILKEVVLEDADIPKAIVGYINHHLIANIVVGASPRSPLVRKFWSYDIPTIIHKSAPEFCSVYVIAKGGKLQFSRIATRPQAIFSTPSKLSTARSLSPSKTKIIDMEDEVRTQQTREGQPSTASIAKKGIANVSADNHFREKRSSSIRKSPTKDSDLPAPPTFGSMDISLSAKNLDFICAQEGHQGGTIRGILEAEAEMRRLKLELEQTMSLYKTACREVASAKEKAKEIQEWKLEKACRFEQARSAEVAALAMVEMEKFKCRAAIESAEKARQLAEMETRRRKLAELKAKHEEEAKNRTINSLSKNDIRYRKYTIEEIEIATDNFSKSFKIGEGGYGPVFKAKLDHTPVAIKVLRSDAAQGKRQFQQEVEVLSCIRHPNMVLLLGACPDYGCLVYEFMNYGSLEDRLFRKGETSPIPWRTRFKIAAEIATGLLFLHQTKPEPLVHRDLKPANILLDWNYECKISDVGLSRLVPASVADSVTQYHMTSAAGTFCYIDPEYQQTGKLGTKSDIYSLGVMLLQIITARPPMGLSYQVEKAVENGTFADILDPTVPDWPVEEALDFAKLSLKCVQLRKKDRPDLGSVIVPELNRLKKF